MRVIGLSLFVLLVLGACSGPGNVDSYRPQASPSRATPTATPLPTTAIDDLMRRPGSLGITTSAFVAVWNTNAKARNFPSLNIAALTTRPNGDLNVAALDFSAYLHLEATVNGDGSLRSVAIRDTSVTIDLSEVVQGDDALEFALLPPTAALARNILGGASNPRLTPTEQAHLTAAVVGSEEPDVLGAFGKTPVFATLDEKGVRYTFLTDTAGALWYIAQAATSSDLPTGSPNASASR